MSRISIPTADNSLDAAKLLLSMVSKQFGVVPNLMKLVRHSPATQEGYLSCCRRFWHDSAEGLCQSRNDTPDKFGEVHPA
jgi:hypothetical protein